MTIAKLFAADWLRCRIGARAWIGECVALLFAALLALLAVEVAAQRAPAAPHGFSYPAAIGEARRGEAKDFEATSPGLGSVATYDLPGWRISVFAYDLRRTDIPERPAPETIKPQLAQATSDVLALQKRGDYSKAEVAPAFQVPAGGTPAGFDCTAFVLTAAGIGGITSASSEFDSFVCVSTWNRQFIKVRLSAARSAGAAARAQAFVAALDGHLRQTYP